MCVSYLGEKFLFSLWTKAFRMCLCVKKKKRLCSSWLLFSHPAFHFFFHAQYAHYCVINNVWARTVTMPICSAPPRSECVKTHSVMWQFESQPSEETVADSSAFPNSTISCFQMCSQPTQPVWEKLNLVGMATMEGCLNPLHKYTLTVLRYTTGWGGGGGEGGMTFCWRSNDDISFTVWE